MAGEGAMLGLLPRYTTPTQLHSNICNICCVRGGFMRTTWENTGCCEASGGWRAGGRLSNVHVSDRMSPPPHPPLDKTLWWRLACLFAFTAAVLNSAPRRFFIYFFKFSQLVSAWRFENLPRFLPHSVRRQNLRCVVKIIIPPISDVMSLRPSVRLAVIYARGVRSRCSSLLCFIWKRKKIKQTHLPMFPTKSGDGLFIFFNKMAPAPIKHPPNARVFLAKCSPRQMCERWAGLRRLWYEEIKMSEWIHVCGNLRCRQNAAPAIKSCHRACGGDTVN